MLGAVGAVLALAATGCSSSSSKAGPSARATNAPSSSTPTSTTPPAPTDRDLAAALLRTSDLPTGWTAEATSPTTGSLCNQGLIEQTIPPLVRVKAQFAHGRDMPVLSEELLAYADAATVRRVIDKLQTEARACTTYKAGAALVTIGRPSVPALGQRSVAYQLSIVAGGQTVVSETQVIQHGAVIAYVGYLAPAPGAQQLASVAKLAYDKAVRTLHLH